MTQGAMIWREGDRWYGAIASDEGVELLLWSQDRTEVERELPKLTDLNVGAAVRRNLERLRRELHEYHVGSRTRFTIRAAPKGTRFQMEVWEALCRIPFGKSTSYGELAKQVGKPKASRAVGQAMKCNPVPIIIPCHRVLGSGGKIGGFTGGLEEKRKLLRHEGIDWTE